jgi:hypothetical protein
VLNSETWENILNHILPVAKEELHASFYGNILKNFSRGLKVGVSGKGEYCEVTVSHGLVCRYVLVFVYHTYIIRGLCHDHSSVADPDLDPPDPAVFGPPRIRSILEFQGYTCRFS